MGVILYSLIHFTLPYMLARLALDIEENWAEALLIDKHVNNAIIIVWKNWTFMDVKVCFELAVTNIRIFFRYPMYVWNNRMICYKWLTIMIQIVGSLAHGDMEVTMLIIFGYE